MSNAVTQAERGERFKTLHTGAPFVIPNAWDLGTAKLFAAQGFQAVATTSSGHAFTLGRVDGEVAPDEVYAHVGSLAGATALPLSADLENGFGAEPAQAADAIAQAAAAGAVGGSIEDFDPETGLYAPEHAAERVAAAVEAARALEFTFTLTARAENHIRGNPDLEDTIARLQAYERMGADVLYAPGLRTAEEIRAVCAEIERPLNVLARPGLPVAEVMDAGAQRVSVGGWLAWVAAGAVAAASQELLDGGALAKPAAEVRLDQWFAP